MLAFFTGTGGSDAFDAEAAASALVASLDCSPPGQPQPAGGAPPPAPPAQAREVWDRAEFLSAAAANNALLLELLDGWLADALPSPPALAAALGSLFSALEADVDALCAARMASFQSVAAASGLSPQRVALTLRSRAFQAHIRGALSAWLLDAGYWRGCGKEAVGQWLGRGGGGSGCGGAPPSPAQVSSLCDLAAAHQRLALWPHVVDANAQWRCLGARAGAGAAAPYDAKAHSLFSLSGRPVGEGARVLSVGPRLLGREPLCALGGEGGAHAASAEELGELGGARCRCIVIEAP
jgi:hypothetical protein